ncbi:MAG: PAS domain-containing protein [Bdellovibrionales bacterium]|nr:PAS domain-containing protein [Bdellovibrionales bacterium]
MNLPHLTEVTAVARQQLVDVLMNVPLPLMVLHGPSHLIVLSNRSELAKTLDRVPVGRTFASVFPELAERVVPILDRVYRDGVNVEEKEIALENRYLNITYFPLRGEAGFIEGVIVSTLDVTADVVVRRAAENQQKWLEHVLDLIPVPTILVEPETARILLVNVAGQRQLAGFPHDPNTTDSIADYYFSDLQGRRLPIREWPRFRAARGEELFGLQLVWHTPEKSIPIVVESRTLPQAYGHPAVVALHYHDVSDLKEAEFALRESITDLQRERELRERFVTTLTHDLRSPLTAAKLTAEMIAKEPPSPGVLMALANRISGNISRADRMVRDLLDANRLKAGESLPLRLANHCLNDIVQSAVDSLRVLHGERFQIHAEVTVRGRWCRSSLKRILDNLCGNAAKYGAPGTPITIGIELEGSDSVVLSVHNFGWPIPREEQAGLFRPYHRTKTAECGGERGWGLGLALVRGLAEAHSGGVALAYSDERGTRFDVRLPLQAPQNP